MRKMDKELIDHIKDNLLAHEEAYAPGAWERFSVQEEKKRRGFIYWPLWSAAAIILILGGVFFFQNTKAPKNVSIVKTSKPVIKKQEIENEVQLSKTATISGKPKKTVPGNTINPSTNNLNNLEKNLASTFQVQPQATIVNNSSISNIPVATNTNSLNMLYNRSNLTGVVHSDRIVSNFPTKKIELVPEKKKPITSKITFEQLLERDSYNNKLSKAEKIKSATKWEPGIYVAPSMGNDNKVNMNYGFSLSYNLADKLSISSGIAYSALSTTSNPSANNGSENDAIASVASSSKAVAYSSASRSLESINASVSGINIPVELKYNINNKFYTGIGISALAVTNNKQDNNYIVSSAQNTAVANTFGITEQKMLIVTERVSEPQNESTTADKLIGFYNFSLGYKQKISKKNNFAVEPFLRVPMKTFSTDKLNLTNGGVRLKFDF